MATHRSRWEAVHAAPCRGPRQARVAAAELVGGVKGVHVPPLLWGGGGAAPIGGGTVRGLRVCCCDGLGCRVGLGDRAPQGARVVLAGVRKRLVFSCGGYVGQVGSRAK